LDAVVQLPQLFSGPAVMQHPRRLFRLDFLLSAWTWFPDKQQRSNLNQVHCMIEDIGSFWKLVGFFFLKWVLVIKGG